MTSRATAYDARLDQFRVREGIDIGRWASEADLLRTQLNKYRSAFAEPNVEVLAKLVRAASRILQRHVKASELYDLGEAEPLGQQRQFRGNPECRKAFGSRLDEFLRRIEFPSSALAREAATSKNTLLQFRARRSSPRVSTVRQIVVALRRMGYDVTPSDIIDVGEE